MNHLILASGSPRRRELLSLYTTDFTVCVSDFDESAVTAAHSGAAGGGSWPSASACAVAKEQHPDAVVMRLRHRGGRGRRCVRQAP